VWIATAGVRLFLLSSLHLLTSGIQFSVFVGFFNAFTTLLSQIYAPYGISNTTAGYYGAVLIATGLFAAACISPIIGKYEKSMTACKFIGPLISITYMLVIWTPGQSEAFTYVVMAILGGSSFTLMPIVLEWLVDMTYPIQPELTSAMGWMGGQTFGIIFLLVMQALKADEHANPPYNMTKYVIQSLQSRKLIKVVLSALSYSKLSWLFAMCHFYSWWAGLVSTEIPADQDKTHDIYTPIL